jgi:hypothetical protein
MPSVQELKDNLSKAKNPEYNTTAIHWQGKNYPIPQRCSINVLADNILNAMDDSQYENLVVCGRSGSGKTTFVTALLHNMVCKRMAHDGKKFNIQWYRQGDIGKLDDVIAGIVPGTPTILVLDDVSYELSKVSASRKKDIFSAMTTIRHQVKSQILVVFITHYSRSLEKYLRSDAGFTVLLSLSNQELGNWIDIFGDWAKWKLSIFQRQYSHSKQKGTFMVKFGDGQQYAYRSKEPFKIAMVNELGTDLHPVLFMSEYCGNCSNGKKPVDVVKPDILLQQVQKACGNYGTFALREYLADKLSRPELLPPMLLQARNYIIKTFTTYAVEDMNALGELIMPKTSAKRYTKKKQRHLEMMKLLSVEEPVSEGFKAIFQ